MIRMPTVVALLPSPTQLSITRSMHVGGLRREATCAIVQDWLYRLCACQGACMDTLTIVIYDVFASPVHFSPVHFSPVHFSPVHFSPVIDYTPRCEYSPVTVIDA